MREFHWGAGQVWCACTFIWMKILSELTVVRGLLKRGLYVLIKWLRGSKCS